MKSTTLIATFAIGAAAQAPQPNPAPVPFGPKPAGCSKFEVLVARGTSEPGPYGKIVGDPLMSKIMKAMPDSRGYAVQYPADLSDKSVDTGATDVVNRLEAQAKACPEQKFALVGYSQGGIVMHQAAAKIPEEMQKDKILAMVMFGDPGLNSGEAKPLPPVLVKKLWENCAVGDPVCTTGKDLAPHLSYDKPGTKYQEDSTKFIVMAFEGKPLPARPMAPVPGEEAPGAPKESAAPGAPKESGAPKEPGVPGAPKESAAPGAPKESTAPKESAMPKESLSAKESMVPSGKEPGAPKESGKEPGMPKMSSMMTMSMSMAPVTATAKTSVLVGSVGSIASTVSAGMPKESGMSKESGKETGMPKMSSGMTMSMTMSASPKETAGVPMPMPKSSEMPSGMSMSMPPGMTMSSMAGMEPTSSPAVQTNGALGTASPSTVCLLLALSLMALWM